MIKKTCDKLRIASLEDMNIFTDSWEILNKEFFSDGHGNLRCYFCKHACTKEKHDLHPTHIRNARSSVMDYRARKALEQQRSQLKTSPVIQHLPHKSSPSIKNICASNAMLQMLACSYIANPLVAEYCQKRNKVSDIKYASFFKFFEAFGIEKIDKVLERRDALILAYFSTKVGNNSTVVDCKCNVFQIQEDVLKSTVPSCIETMSCTCGIKNRPALPMREKLQENFIEELEKKFNGLRPGPAVCDECNAVKISKFELSPIILIDCQEVLPIEIARIPSNITMQDKIYQLKSFIEYEPPKGKYVAHYIAHVMTGNTWMQYDDQRDTPVPQSGEEIIVHCLMYVEQVTKSNQ